MGDVRPKVVAGALVSAGLASTSLLVGAAAPVTSGVLAVFAVLVMIIARRSGRPRD
ncbi:hypothetical protein [Lentzea kentuckyensis]|uniref:hypothetical protein n=1 Tax=Lentzea kentuckyensis TaxID=360086 RepID=UPI001302DF9D|nr:hypothetical protein [Lentzea kentuckyensis]